MFVTTQPTPAGTQTAAPVPEALAQPDAPPQEQANVPLPGPKPSYLETLTYGQSKCIDGGTVILTPMGHSVRYERQQDGVKTVSGDLSASQAN
jgi:hypothetical protein